MSYPSIKLNLSYPSIKLNLSYPSIKLNMSYPSIKLNLSYHYIKVKVIIIFSIKPFIMIYHQLKKCINFCANLTIRLFYVQS